MKNYDLIIVSSEHFPFGQATTNRLVCYATAIAQSKSVLYLTSAGPLYGDNWGNTQRDGCYNGIDFHYMGQTHCEKPSKPVRFLRLIGRYIKLLYQLSFKYKAKSILAVNNRLPFDCAIKLICAIRGHKLYIEISETPLRTYPESKAPLIRKISAIYDGFLIISPGIRDYYPNLPQERFFFLPMLVDMNRFEGIIKTEGKYMLYCSGGNLERDGFLDILKGFVAFHKSHPDYTLKVATLIRDNDDYHKKCRFVMNQHTDCIEYLGQIPTTAIPPLTVGSTCLMVTPHHKYDTVGFPTKLGEFFASKKPVIISSIPDLQMIPQDCAYFVNPNRPDMIADAMDSIVSKPEEAQKVGQIGYEYAVEQFTMENYIEPLISFIGI